jgi:hypothetical protein
MTMRLADRRCCGPWLAALAAAAAVLPVAAARADAPPAAAVTLHAGETFYEGPEDVHVRSANPDVRVPARLLVFMVKDLGRPVSRPAQASQESAG